jgi:hypothetical protein
MASIRVSFIAPYDRCAVCDSGDCVGTHSIDLDKETQIRWWRCADCGLVFQNPRLTGQSLRALYARLIILGFAAATTACCGMLAVTSGEAWWGN